jgi:hypothetical protein
MSGHWARLILHGPLQVRVVQESARTLKFLFLPDLDELVESYQSIDHPCLGSGDSNHIVTNEKLVNGSSIVH